MAKKNQKVILTGCMLVSALGERRRYTLRQLKNKLPQVDEFKTIEELIISEEVSPIRKKKTSALVPIMRGCDHFCSYCVVPYARGKEKSRPFKEILGEVEKLDKNMLEEIEFWRVVMHNSNFLIFEDTLSFENLQKMNAILDMNDDTKKAIEEYHKQSTGGK